MSGAAEGASPNSTPGRSRIFSDPRMIEHRLGFEEHPPPYNAPDQQAIDENPTHTQHACIVMRPWMGQINTLNL